MLERLLGSQARAALLRVLFTEEHRKVHLRELARVTGVAAPNLLREARNLAAEGVLVEEKDGNRVLYAANHESPLYAALAELVAKSASGEAPLYAALAELVAKSASGEALLRAALSKGAAEVAFIYGSRAKGTARTDSDYDVFVVTNEGLRTVIAELAEAHERIGVEVNPYVVTPEEFRRRVQEKDHFLTEVMAGEKIFLKGGADELAAMAG